MSSATRPLLPLFYVAKRSGLRSALNERTLIFILLGSSLITIWLIFRNLPSSVVNEVQFKEIFIPKINEPAQQGNKYAQIEHPLPQPDSNHQDSGDKRDVVKDPVNEMRRNRVRNMTLLAWNSYKEFAWGKNELKPISKTGHTPGIFGYANDLGATIVDAMDTLYIMGLHDQFNDGTKWIKENFNIMIDTDLSFFEVNIRFIGGFLALYTLTKEKLYLDKAIEVADAFMPAFSTATGYSFSLFNPVRKSGKNYNWAASQCSILSEFGTLSLEFQYLSDLTGNTSYQEKIEKIYQSLEKAKKKEGLYYNYANPHTGSWCSSQASMAGLGDSFYEYLLKYWLYKDKTDSKMLDTYLKAMEGIRSKLVGTSGGFTFLGEYSNGALQPKMGHLACFSGGLFALSAMQSDLPSSERDEFRRLAIEITRTCHESYIRMPTRIGPEAFSFSSGREFDALDNYYILRPEVIEAYFYLWKMTKDEKYRDWAWDATEAIEKYCRTEHGYTGIRDVRSTSATQDDVQQSFFFAETLKYLYLIFSDDEPFPLDKYVFNTEAHPFLIRKSK